MTVFNDIITKLRRFLRDPSGDIWSDADLLTYWNDAQIEIAQKTNYIEKAEAYRFPPIWTWSYMFDWERQETDGDRFQCLYIWQARNVVGCYPWEPGYYATNSSTADSGDRWTHPWEAEYADSRSDIVPIPLHEKIHRTKFVAYDEDELRPTTRKELALRDPHYRTCTGQPVSYYRPDEYHNMLILYPYPASVTWDEALISGYVTDTYQDTGGITAWDEDHIRQSDTGIILEEIEIDGQVFMVYDALPKDVESDVGHWHRENVDWPQFLTKYVEYATLERAYGANTDGFIPSLRDYWMHRKNVGIEMIKRFNRMRIIERDYQLGAGTQKLRRKHPRLPAGYPATNP